MQILSPKNTQKPYSTRKNIKKRIKKEATKYQSISVHYE